MVIALRTVAESKEIYVTAMVPTLLLPAAYSMLVRHRTLRSEQADQPQDWIKGRRRLRLVILFTVPAWWSLVTQSGAKPFLPFPTWFLLLAPLSIAVFLAQVLAYWSDATFLGRRWAGGDIFGLAAWNTLSSPVPLLATAIALEALHNHRSIGIFWIGCAAVALMIGTVRLKSAEGLKPRPVKSGELYKRSLVLSKKMGVRLRRVCVVPFGRGRLTNAFGGWNGIALTDDYGHWLHGSELDFIIGHELAHVKYRDGLRKVLVVSGLFGTVAAAAVAVPNLKTNWPVLFNFAAIYAPLVVFYFLSRRREYAADQAAVTLTGDGETGIRALSNLYRHVGAPTTMSRFEELFSTHPPLSRRAEAIARVGHIPAERLGELLGDFTRSTAGGSGNC